MAMNEGLLAVFPGSFDPVTNGHLDVIRRGAEIFGGLIVAVCADPSKSPLLSAEARAEIIRRATAAIPGVRVEIFRGLTVDFVRRCGAAAILRGIRDSADLRAELQMAMTNRMVAGVETLFMPAGPRYAFTSSSLIRQIASMGGDVSNLVPPEALPHLRPGAKRKAPRGRK